MLTPSCIIRSVSPLRNVMWDFVFLLLQSSLAFNLFSSGQMCMVLCNLQVLWTRSGWPSLPLNLSCCLIQPGTDFWMISLDSIPESRHAWWPHHLHFYTSTLKKKRKKKKNECFENPGSFMKDNGWIRLYSDLLWYYCMLETYAKSWSWRVTGPGAKRSSLWESLELEVFYLTLLVREMCLIAQSHSWIVFSVALWFILPFVVADHTVFFFASSACFFLALSVSVLLKVPIFFSNLLLEGAEWRPLSDNLSLLKKCCCP